MPHALSAPTLKVTGAARLYRAASSDRRERGRPTGWASGLRTRGAKDASKRQRGRPTVKARNVATAVASYTR